MFGLLKKGLAKTREVIRSVVRGEGGSSGGKVSREVVEEALIEADIDYDLVEEIVSELPKEVKREKLRKVLLSHLPIETPKLEIDDSPFTILIIGVNGAGKTTTIGKLAHRFLNEGRSVILGAGDTFRAAAIEQLTIWAERLGVPIVKTRQGHDPAAVAYDTVAKAKAKGIEVAIIDTAGRLHNKKNLQLELQKIGRVLKKAHPTAPNKVFLVIDGTQGSSAVAQAKVFNEIVGVDGIIVTKLDGTAKGGSIFTIVKELNLPIQFVGVGERAEDLIPFDREEYVDSILDAIYGEEKGE
jgi:fused signal recognition particle receptor